MPTNPRDDTPIQTDLAPVRSAASDNRMLLDESGIGASGDVTDADFDRAIEQFSVLYPFPLDDFQREAIRTLLHGDSVMVAAPTGTGKTVVAEFGVLRCVPAHRAA